MTEDFLARVFLMLSFTCTVLSVWLGIATVIATILQRKHGSKEQAENHEARSESFLPYAFLNALHTH